MVEENLEKRVNELARDVDALKVLLLPTDAARRASPIQRGLRFLIANWVLLSFIAAGITAIYVKFVFDIDPLESYRDVSSKKVLSEFYRKLGDRMMIAAEWDAAEHAYRQAITLNPNNSLATFGVAKAQVFQPLPGRKIVPPEIVNARLEYLASALPNDANVYYLQAVRYQNMGDTETADKLLRECISRDDHMTACYVSLGFIDWGQYKLDDAIANFTKAIQLDPSFAPARNNLGFCYLLLLKFSDAANEFYEAYRAAPNMLSGIHLGDALRFSGDFKHALAFHREVIQWAARITDPDDRYAGGVWRYNFMPLQSGDLVTITKTVWQSNLEEKKAVAHAALSIDLAASDELGSAEAEFKKSLELDGRPEFKEFLANRIRATINFTESISDGAKTWLEDRLKSLDVPQK